jgi:crossover junction endodeoxyribonuclease RuvC
MATFTRRDLTLAAVAVVRILGIDPGTRVVGFGCLEMVVDGPRRSHGEAPLALRASNTVRAGCGSAADVSLMAMGVLRLGARETSLCDRLLALAEQFRALIARLAPDEIAVEEAFYGKSVQAALRIGEARGVVLAESARSGLPVHQFAPARVKRSVAGHGAAAKETVAAMVRQFVATGPALAKVPADATDAVAVALTRVEQRRSPLAGLLAEAARETGVRSPDARQAPVAISVARPSNPATGQ